MALNGKAPIGVELVKRGVVTENDIQAAIEYQKEHPDKKIGDILNILNLCPQRDLIRAMGEILGEKVMVLRVDSINVNVSDYMSIDVCRACKAVVFDVLGGKAKVCFADTANKRAIEQVRLILLNRGLVMEKFLTFESSIETVIESLEGKADGNITASGDVTGLIDTIIKTGMEKRASDIHIEPLENTIRVRYRIDGELVTVASIEKQRLTQVVGRLKAISNMHQEKQESQDGRILLYNDYNIRVSSQKTINGEKFCLRLLKKNAGIRNIFDLGFPNDEGILKKSFDKRNSITVIAAPTGEGKTTTLYSVLDYLNKPEINVTTVEDPVEIRVSGINQIEVDAKATFASSLRTILRQDPDIILLGEIRDLETAEIALQAGQTGHYVLSTIHTINAVEVITRLRKMGISDYDISSTLATAISQRLIRRICPHCAVKRKFTQQEKNIMNKFAEKYGDTFDFTDKYTYDTKGCKECNYTGYLSRIAAFEILEITEPIRELISEGASSLKVREQALKEGYRPLAMDALQKVVDGKVTLEEVNKKLVLFQ
ncbi:MAG: Flp pilus assembly complex ATPase component TadA [Clostridia bacterium]|nr:Flp pilus assembly complex ATPase component TadA [Clostridia bacterium]